MSFLRVLYVVVVVSILLFPSLAAALPTFYDTALDAAGASLTHSLHKRQCILKPGNKEYTCDKFLPTLDEIVKRMRDESDGGSARADVDAVFYSNLAVAETQEAFDQADSWALHWMSQAFVKKSLKSYWWKLNVNPDWRLAQRWHILAEGKDMIFSEQWGTESPKIFDTCSYHALSAAAVNPTAYVLLPRGKDPKERTWKMDSVWETVEFWSLTQNPNIQKIIRLDPRPPDVVGMSRDEWCEKGFNEEVLWERGKDAELSAQVFCPVLYSEGKPVDSIWKDGRVQPKPEEKPQDSSQPGDGGKDTGGAGGAEPPAGQS